MAKQYGLKAEDYANRAARSSRSCGHSNEEFESCADMMGAKHCIRCYPSCAHHSGYPSAYIGAGREWFTDWTVNLGGPNYDD